MKLEHTVKRRNEVNTIKELANDAPSINKVGNDLILTIAGGKYYDLRYKIILDENDLRRIIEKLSS